MARKGRLDRGLMWRTDAAGRRVPYVRLMTRGRNESLAAFLQRRKPREFYEKAKLEQKEGRFFPERYQRAGHAKLADVINEHMVAFTGRSKRDEDRFARKWPTLFPGVRLNALTPAALEKARAQLMEEGRCQATVNRYMAFLRRVLNKAVRDGLIQSNPVSRIKMFRESSGKTRFLSAEEESALLIALGEPYGSWTRLAILTGLRQMEQFSLRWEHVDLTRGVLTLPATKAGGVQYVRLLEEAKAVLGGAIRGNGPCGSFPVTTPYACRSPELLPADLSTHC